MPDRRNSFDVVVIGAGINGAGIARDAAGRGLSVLICDRGDPGGATSSASSKLVHGGLRYLQYFAFGLIRESLTERARLLAAAPHLVRPMTFLMPQGPDSRPAWMVRLGLFLYDHLAGAKSVMASRAVRLRGDSLGAGLDPKLARGFVYGDCRVDDSRLVILNLRAAADRGAVVLPRTACVRAARTGLYWHLALEDQRNGARREVRARAVVNAAGPWAEEVSRALLDFETEGGLRLVRGSHIVVPRVHAGDHALLLQNPDGRIVFVIPFEEDFSLIGTTERTVDSPAGAAAASPEEVAYLCAAANRYLATPIAPDGVVWSFAGVRPLYDDGHLDDSAVSRDYRLLVDRIPGAGRDPAMVLTVYGGKLTTYRQLAERAVNRIAPLFLRALRARRIGGPWTDATALPGGTMPGGDFTAYVARRAALWPWLPRPHLEALARRHGSLLPIVLAGAQGIEDLGWHFGAGLYERELIWFREREWARTGADVLWRRSKAGLHLDAAARAAVDGWMAAADDV